METAFGSGCVPKKWRFTLNKSWHVLKWSVAEYSKKPYILSHRRRESNKQLRMLTETVQQNVQLEIFQSKAFTRKNSKNLK